MERRSMLRSDADISTPMIAVFGSVASIHILVVNTKVACTPLTKFGQPSAERYLVKDKRGKLTHSAARPDYE